MTFNETVSAAHLVSGIYLIEVNTNGKSITKRFIKN
ncbi:MAG: T9SS type A sorting domain-containing protein [Flavobacterium sp.]|nr:T9SS type A sorting domain-containing protein [Flavobacterium sp.]